MPPIIEFEIPAFLGDLLFSELEKGAGHKYIRRLPTGNAKKPWRYIYSVSGGKGGLGSEAEFEVGSKFKVRHGDKEGHFEIVGKTPEGKLQIKHDESGHVDTVAPAALSAMLRNEHATAISAHREKVRSDLAAVGKHGSVTQRERLLAYARQNENTRDLLDPLASPSIPLGKVRVEDVKQGQRIRLGKQVYEFTGSGWAELDAKGNRTGSVTTNRDIARRSGGLVDLWVAATAKPAPKPEKTPEPAPEPKPRVKEGQSARELLTRLKVAPEPVPVPEPVPEREKHEEVGEHVDLSRKDTAIPLGPRDLAGGVSVDDASAAKRDKLLSRPTAAQSKAAGYSPGAHHLRDAVFKLVSQTPAGGRSEKWERRHRLIQDPENVRAAHFITGCAFLEKTLAGCKTAADIVTAIREMQSLRAAEFQSEKLYPVREGDGHRLSDEDKADALKAFHVGRGYESSTVRVIGARFIHAPQQTPEQQEKGEPPTVIGYRAILRDSLQGEVYGKRFDALGEGFSNLSYGKLSDGFRKAIAESTELDKGNWESAEEARLKGARKIFNWVDLRGEAFDRIGGRKVEKASGPKMAEESGLRNIQYGEWMSQDDREHHVKAAHTALLDLSDMLGVPPATVSLKGRLAIGFGARGTGGKNAAAAHYEPNLKIVNLTKFAGGGSLAHEWGHFLDNVVGETNDAKPTLLGEAAYGSEALPATAPKALQDAYNEVGAAMLGDAWRLQREARETVVRHNQLVAEVNGMMERGASYREQIGVRQKLTSVRHDLQIARLAVDRASTTQFARDAAALGSAYWGSTREMFARAFETFVEDKLHDQGRKNTYLVQGTTLEAATDVPARRDPRKVAV